MGEEHVPWLEIAVDEAGLVGLVKALAELTEEVSGVLDGHPMDVGEPGEEALSVEPLHDQVRGAVLLAEVEHLDDVSAGQVGGLSSLALEASPRLLGLHEGGVHELDGGLGVELHVASEPHRAHPPPRQRAHQRVPPHEEIWFRCDHCLTPR